MALRPDDPPLGHLELNRALIVERSALAGAMAMVPVPFVDDVLAGAARAELLRRVASVRGVGFDEPAIGVLARLDDSGVRSTAGLATRYALRRSFRRLAGVLRAAGHAGDFASTFAIATLFDHYCARHHVGPGLELDSARRLRATIDGAIADAGRGVVLRGARNVVEGASRLLVAAPAAVRGLLPARREEGPLPPERVDPGEALRPVGGSLIDRGARFIGDAIAGSSHGWVAELVAAFDRRWEAAA